MEFHNKFRGLSVEVCFGSWSKIEIGIKVHTFRIYLGFFAVTIKLYDNEKFTHALLWLKNNPGSEYEDYFLAHEKHYKHLFKE